MIVQRARQRARDVASDLTVLARAIRRPLDVVALLLLVSVLAGGVVAVVWSVRYALAVNRLASGVGDVVFYGADGRPWFRLDERRRDVPLEQISPYLQEALIATEDRRFYYHPGIDPVGLLRAVRDNVRRGEAVEGASTLTQQLARTLFLSNARTVGRKGKEAVIALMLEVRLTQVADSRAVPEPRVPQRRSLRRRGHVDEPVRQARIGSDACRSGAHRRPGEGTVSALSVVQFRWRGPAKRSRTRPNAGRRLHHRR